MNFPSLLLCSKIVDICDNQLLEHCEVFHVCRKKFGIAPSDSVDSNPQKDRRANLINYHYSRMWGPVVISWFINPSNYSYKSYKP